MINPSLSDPLVSIIIVNYNGKSYLQDCLGSLSRIHTPRNKYEIIMIDNNSKDMSVDFTQRNFPDVKIIQSKINLGFSGGVNLGVKNSKGKYIVLLNTDTIVETEWLSYLIKAIESSSDIAAVNSKIYLFYRFIELKIHSDVHMRSEFTDSTNFSSVGVLVENVVLEDKGLQDLVRYRSGFYGQEKGPIQARWTKGDATILIPCNPKNENLSFTLTIRAEKSSSNLKTAVTVCLDSKVIIKDKLKSFQIEQYKIDLKVRDIQKDFLSAIQNSGVVVFRSGYARDRGAVIRDAQSFYEIDNSYFNKKTELLSFCGASSIIRKEVFESLGGFDENFFMYYEDVDLSLRMRRNGYRILYEPKSVLRHIHAATSKEWSHLFIYNVEKNHLALLIKHFPWLTVARQFCMYLLMFLISLLKAIKWRLTENWELYDYWREKTKVRAQVINWIIRNFINMYIKRWKINSSSKVKLSALYKKLY